MPDDSTQLAQNLVQEYIQHTSIINTLERALNTAIDRQVSHPDVFVADFLLTNSEKEGLGMQLQSAYQLPNNQILYTVRFLHLLQTFQFSAPNELVKQLGGEVKKPTLVLQQLTNLDFSQNIAKVTEELKKCLQQPHFVYQNFFEIYKTLSRQNNFAATSKLINFNKQVINIPLHIVNFFQITSFARIGVIQLKQNQFQDIQYSMCALQDLTALFSSNRYNVQVSQNEKTNELSCDLFKFTLEEPHVFSFDQFLHQIEVDQINQNLQQKQDKSAAPTQKDAKDAKKDKQPIIKLNNQQLTLLVLKQFANLLLQNKLNKHFKIFLEIDVEQVDTNQIYVRQQSRDLENFFLSCFMQVRDSLALLVKNQEKVRPNLEQVIQQVDPKAKKQPAVQQKPSSQQKGRPEDNATEQLQYYYNKDEVFKDVSNSITKYRQLVDFGVQARFDVQIDQQWPLQYKQVQNQLLQADSLEKYYAALSTQAEQFQHEENQKLNENIILQFNAPRPPTPDAKGKTQKKGEPEKPVERFIQRGQCAIYEGVKYVTAGERAEIDEFVYDVFGVIQDKRAVLGE